MSESNVVAPSQPSNWPKTIGIISTVWAGLNLFCGVCGIGMFFFGKSMLEKGEAQFGPAPDVLRPNPIQVVVGAISMVVPILLLVAGITTLKRRPQGRTLHLAYAVVGMVFGAVGGFIAFRQQFAIYEWAKNNQTDKWVTEGHQGSPIGLIMVAVFTLIGFIWPLFCMIWFGAIKRDTTDLDGGPVEPGV